MSFSLDTLSAQTLKSEAKALRTERELLDVAVATNRSEHGTTKTRFEQAKDDEQRHADRLKQRNPVF